MSNRVQSNPLQTRQQMIDAAMDLIRPVLPFLSSEGTRLNFSAACAHYDEAVAGMEGFSRILWAIVPMLMGNVPEIDSVWEIWRNGLVRGTDPENDGYWGDIGPFDQRMVEMAVIGMGLSFVPERFFAPLPENAKADLCKWLMQINSHDMPKNNWKFFRVLVNMGLLTVGYPCGRKQMEADLDELESHYTRNGWYFDKPTQRDYYTLWAFHYYGLLYAFRMKDDDPERSARFIQRAQLIAPRFACWFDAQGRGLPYGRSLTYRFAQSSFWSAFALAHAYTEEITPGMVKGMLLRNLRYWFGMPIFDRDGVLSVGYGYPDYIVSEGYNAPGSPYWSMKSFAVLALPESDPFWQSTEEPWPSPERFCDKECLQLILRGSGGCMVTSYTSGNHAYEHMHEDEKYEKFAYSTQFGFSVVKEAGTLSKGAYDSMLAVKRAGKDLWHARSGYESYSVEEDRVSCVWKPMEGLTVETVIIPVDGSWHIRRHILHADYELEAAEGAFAVIRDRPGKRPCDRIRTALVRTDTIAAAHCDAGSTAIFAIRGYREGTVVQPEANTNMLYPRTVLPTLLADIHPGDTVLMCAVFASGRDECPDTIPEYVLKEAEKYAL